MGNNLSLGRFLGKLLRNTFTRSQEHTTRIETSWCGFVRITHVKPTQFCPLTVRLDLQIRRKLPVWQILISVKPVSLVRLDLFDRQCGDKEASGQWEESLRFIPWQALKCSL